MIGVFQHGARSFLRNLHRYRVVLFALVLVVGVLVFVLGAVLGIRTTLREKASRYFAGDVVVLGYIGDGNSRIDQPEAVLQAVQQAEASRSFDTRTVSRRSSYYDSREIALFFAGYWTPQRRLVGVEWDREEEILSGFDFAEGGVPEPGDGEAVLISTAVAEELHARVGDRILVSIISRRGRSNTAELTVSGIYRETSFFGYTTYMERKALNRLKEVPEDRVNEIGVYLQEPGRSQGVAARAITEALAAEGLPTFEVLTDRDAYSDASRERREERHYGVVTLQAQLSEITDLLRAVTLIAGVIIVLFLGIVVIGVGNTYSMIVYERTKEIGTLRALGVSRTRTIGLFLLESLFLGLAGVILGGALGVGSLAAVEQFVQFPDRVWSTLFFVGRRLRWILPLEALAAIAALALGASLLGALRSAVRAGMVRPVDALRQEK
jgi:ABC-type lipoprotein release transport system permease subunit